jgi:UDP-galactopyranose mutase
LKHIKGFFQPNSVVNYPGPEVDYTRIVEYKHFLHQTSPHTTIVYERTTDQGDPYYPVPTKKNQEVYKKYQALAEKEQQERNVHFIGRLANYKYYNMDDAIKNALDYFCANF